MNLPGRLVMQTCCCSTIFIRRAKHRFPESIPQLYGQPSRKTATRMEYIGQAQNTLDFLLANTKPGDTVITLGAGSVYKIGEVFLEQLDSRGEKK